MTHKVSTLSNGMKVVTDTVPHVESITIGLWTHVGTRDENNNQMGMAHFLEHMIFKGTSKRSAQDIADEIESVGGHFNAYTSREQTAYYIRALADHTLLALDILSDVLKNSTFVDHEFAREKNVILQEIGQCHDTPDDIIFDDFMATAYPEQSAGWSILGTVDTVQNFTKSQLIEFVQQQYSPRKMVLSVAGKIDHEWLHQKAEEFFGDFKPNTPQIAKAEAVYKGGKFTRKRELEQTHIIAGFQGLPLGHKLYYPMHVFSTLWGGGMSSKLFQEVREKRGLAYSIYSFCHHFSDGGTLGIYAGTDPKRATELLDCLQDLFHQAPENISENEVKRAQTQLKSNILMSRESMSSRCEIAAQHTLHYGQPKNIESIIQKIEDVTLTDIKKVIEHLYDSIPTLCAIGPNKSTDSALNFSIKR